MYRDIERGVEREYIRSILERFNGREDIDDDAENGSESSDDAEASATHQERVGSHSQSGVTRSWRCSPSAPFYVRLSIICRHFLALSRLRENFQLIYSVRKSHILQRIDSVSLMALALPLFFVCSLKRDSLTCFEGTES